MNAMRKLAVTLLAGSLLQVSSNALAGAAHIRQARNFEVHEITLNGEGCAVSAIDSGVAVGSCLIAGGAEMHAFVWTEATGVIDIGTLGGTWSSAIAIDGPRVVGSSSLSGDAQTHAFSWTAEEGMVDLGAFGDASIATSVSGDAVVGYAFTAAGESHAFVWTPTLGMIDLPRLASGTQSSAYEVHGDLIAGYSSTNGADFRSDRPVAWTTAGQLIDLLGEPIEFDENGWVRGVGQADAVSNGLVVGHTLNVSAGTFRAFAWREGRGVIDLGLIRGFAESTPIDTDGQWVVGNVFTPGLRAFIWSEATGMKAITPRSITARASHVSNGRVLGYYFSEEGFTRPFLWTRRGGLVDVTPADFPLGSMPTGIDAEGRIAVTSADPGFNIRSAILIPKRMAK